MIPIIISILIISQTFCTTDLYVGYPDKKKDFSTIQDALDEAASINPKMSQKESQFI